MATKVLAAKYGGAQGYRDIQMAEIQRDVSLALYSNLGQFQARLPRPPAARRTPGAHTVHTWRRVCARRQPLAVSGNVE
jgi:hypothetical protein